MGWYTIIFMSEIQRPTYEERHWIKQSFELDEYINMSQWIEKYGVEIKSRYRIKNKFNSCEGKSETG